MEIYFKINEPWYYLYLGHYAMQIKMGIELYLFW
jgi:hypothetical protein